MNTSVKQYIETIPEDRRQAFIKLKDCVSNNLPKGFQVEMSYGMIGFVVPHSAYPAGYHCNPKLPLPFLNIANQKNFIALYHMGLYANPNLLKWFEDEYLAITGKKADMGKSCIRFKKPDQIPFELIGQLCQKISMNDWISTYERLYKPKA